LCYIAEKRKMSIAIIEQRLIDLESIEISDAKTLDSFKIEWLSKKGIVSTLHQEIKNIPNEDKKFYGQKINALNQKAQELYNQAEAKIKAVLKKEQYKNIDLTLPTNQFLRGSLHPLSLIRDEIEDIFMRLGFTVSEGPEITDEWYNFTALNIPEEHPARDMADTFFVETREGRKLMRTHTSNVQILTMQKEKPPIRIIAPGRVYRKDSDSTHSPMFHQVEGLFVDKNVSFADLKGTLYSFIQQMFGEDTEVRFRPSYFPFTEPSAEVDILSVTIDPNTGKEKRRWLEILGSGMVDPEVLKNCNIDPEEYGGFAFGMGIERIAMLKYKIDDIRVFYDNNLKFLRQFQHA